MKFTQQSASGGSACIACSGPITQIELTRNKDPLQELLGQDFYSRPLLLDLHKTDYIDSSGIGWLLNVHKRFLQDGGVLVLHSVPPVVHQVVQLMRLDKILNIQSDLAAAKASVAEREKKS